MILKRLMVAVFLLGAAQGYAADEKHERSWRVLEAVKTGESLEGLQDLIAAGIDPNVRGSFEDTICHHAARLNLAHLIEILVQEGADVNAKDMDSYTPLHVASGCGSLDALEVLLKYGADTEIRTCNGKRPIECANESNREGVVFLMDNCASGVGLEIKEPAVD